jgi:hypothetical protein
MALAALSSPTQQLPPLGRAGIASEPREPYGTTVTRTLRELAGAYG